jgi:hypothetical protein
MDRVCLRLCLFAALAATFLLAPAQAAGRESIPRTPVGHPSRWVITDLDGDRQTDFAGAGFSRRDGRDYVQEIHLRFSSFAGDTVTVRTRLAGERLIARDLDGDADRDLVLEGFNREPIAVLLNDGDGHFHEADLADFFFQLSHRSPRSFAAMDPELSSPESGECPNDEPMVVPFTESRPELDGTRLIGRLAVRRPVSAHSDAASRGPPASR